MSTELLTYLQAYKDDGTLSELKRKWFDRQSQCRSSPQLDGGAGLHVSQMTGAFLFLIIGFAVALLMGSFEAAKWWGF